MGNAPRGNAAGALENISAGIPAGKPLFVRLRLPKARHAVAFLPLIAFLEDFNPFEPLQDVALGPERRGGTETVML
jgi:hypothetical protein